MRTRTRKKQYWSDSYLKLSTWIKFWIIWSIIFWSIIAFITGGVKWFLFIFLFLNIPILFGYFLYIISKVIIFIRLKIKYKANVFQKSHTPINDTDGWYQRKNSENYYNVEKIKNNFSEYLFWKYIGYSVLIFCNTYIISFFALSIFLQKHH